MSSLGVALKAFRRGVHVYGPAWHCVLITRPHTAMNVFLDEVVPIMAATSLEFEAHHASTTIRTKKGGWLRVCGVNDSIEAYVLTGQQLTQIIWLHFPPDPVREYVRAMLRSNTVPREALREDTVTI